MSYFKNTPVNIVGNTKLRSPQLEAYLKIQEFFLSNESGEALVVLPTGTGKTGLISIAPYGISQGRVLIISPGLVTKRSISKAQEVLEDNFWVNFDIIFNPNHLPIVVDYHPDVLPQSLIDSHIVYSNIQRVASQSNNSLWNKVPPDFFDMIIIDESHHAPANSWQAVLDYFTNAKKLFVTGTPFRGDNQELPGVKIHETHLSEVMRDRYVKFLRKETVNAHQLFFTMPEREGQRLTISEVLAIKDKEWIEKSVALSKECSLDVINNGISQLNELKKISPTVPHKILAVGCSIAHAEDLKTWFEEKGLTAIIVHSRMPIEEVSLSFQAIDNHECDVVISVNMLMEGYDHKYLTILCLFRPYRSLNAFAQVVGRILRAIPDNEITDFEIDNNAVVIYHEETGLNSMWQAFQTEVDRGRKQRVADYSFLDREYSERESYLGKVSSDQVFVSDQDSYLDDIDFNKLFNEKKEEISSKVDSRVLAIPNLSPEEQEILRKGLLEKETEAMGSEIEQILMDKRPELARKKLRNLLVKKSQDAVANLLNDKGQDAKGYNLAPQFQRYVFQIPPNCVNDGVLMLYINAKLRTKFGAVGQRDNATLIKSIDYIPNIIAELERMIL